MLSTNVILASAAVPIKNISMSVESRQRTSAKKNHKYLEKVFLLKQTINIAYRITC